MEFRIELVTDDVTGYHCYRVFDSNGYGTDYATYDEADRADRRIRIEAIADRLHAVFTDPTHPTNQLKRPAKRSCIVCGETYRSRVSLLADRGYCPDCIDVTE